MVKENLWMQNLLLSENFVKSIKYQEGTYSSWFSWFRVFNTIFNNISVISWRLVLLVEETGVLGENHLID